MSDKIKKSDDEWRQQLTAEQFEVTRKHATERPFSGVLNDTKSVGIYNCICCGEPLFSSDTKFDSGSGWPSFFQPLDEQAVGETEDNSLFMKRVEVHCNKCDAHLGHVFPDGPQPTGIRYCVNSASLDFQEDR